MRSKTIQLITLTILSGIIFLFGSHIHADEALKIFVGKFSEKNLNGWETKAFVSQTHYSFSTSEDIPALKADSQHSASGLIKKIQVDLEKTPYLNWKWRVDLPLAGTFEEKEKSGDDYAARIYVVVSGGLAFWNTRALNYVWAKHSSKGDTWPNAFAGENAFMQALRSHEDKIAVWYSEKRNVMEDFQQAFGRRIRFIDAVVIMSDTDNTNNKTTAHYGDIYFSDQ